MTELLTTRQQMAATLAGELDKLDGVWTVSPLPLGADRKLRVQILDCVRNSVIQTVRDWGHEPVCVSVQPRIEHGPVTAACIYEIDLPRDQVPVQDRTIYGEVVDRTKAAPEKAAVEAKSAAILGKRR